MRRWNFEFSSLLHMRAMVSDKGVCCTTKLQYCFSKLNDNACEAFERSMTLSSLVLPQGVTLRRLTNWHAIEGIRDNLSNALLLRVAHKQEKHTAD